MTLRTANLLSNAGLGGTRDATFVQMVESRWSITCFQFLHKLLTWSHQNSELSYAQATLIGSPADEMHHVVVLLRSPHPHQLRLLRRNRRLRGHILQPAGESPRVRLMVGGSSRSRWLRRLFGRRRLLGPDGGLHHPDAHPAHVAQAHRCCCN